MGKDTKYQLKYLKTDKGKLTSKKAFKKWYDKNKEQIKLKKQKEYLQNIDHIKGRVKKYNNEHKDEKKTYKKAYDENNKPKLKVWQKKSHKKMVETITDGYAVKILVGKRGFKKEQITNNPELIKIQKLIIKTKRLCKTSQN